jgi:hypothetical protein
MTNPLSNNLPPALPVPPLPAVPPGSPNILAGDGSIAVDAACLGCGYNLRGMQPQGGMCPECGKPVEQSFDIHQLRFAPRDQLASLMRVIIGTLVSVCVAPVSAGVIGLFSMIGRMSFEEEVSGASAEYIGYALCIAVPLIPLWLFLPRDGSRRDSLLLSEEQEVAWAWDNLLGWRYIASITLGIASVLILAALAAASREYSVPWACLLLVVLAFTSIMTFAALMNLMSRLARRLPAPRIATWLKRCAGIIQAFAYVFCGPLLLGLTWAFLLGQSSSGCLRGCSSMFAMSVLVTIGPLMLVCSFVSLAALARRIRSYR